MKLGLVWFLLALVACNITANNSCTTSYNTLGCMFYVNPLDDECSNFTFSECTWEHCAYYTHMGNITYCGKWQTVTSTDWGECLNNCCDFGDRPQEYSTLQQCQSKNKLKYIIIAAVIGGIFFIALLVFLILCIKQKIAACCQRLRQKWRNCFDCFKSAKINAQLENQAMNEAQTQNKLKCQGKKDWIDCSNADTELANFTDCAICLERFPTIKLECKHVYHYKCITTSMKIRPQCPLCLSSKLETITLFCSKCLQKKVSAIKLESVKDGDQICSKCKC